MFKLQMSGELTSRQCIHDIPVEVISKKNWDDYKEPEFSDFHVSYCAWALWNSANGVV